MTVTTDLPDAAPSDARVVAAQLRRVPREPWRVGARCEYGYPTVLISPAVLRDTALFPTYAWLTCPWLAGVVASQESAGAAARWSTRAAGDADLAAALCVTDARLRAARQNESGGVDACESVGLAGQRDPLKVKCIHAHVALELVGIEDPIGRDVLASAGRRCPDRMCDRLAYPGEEVGPHEEDS